MMAMKALLSNSGYFVCTQRCPFEAARCGSHEIEDGATAIVRLPGIAVDLLPLRSNADALCTRSRLVDEALSFSASATTSHGWAKSIRVRNLIMKRIIAAIFAVACLVGYTPAFAAGAHGGGATMPGGGMSSHRVHPMTVPNLQGRIPGPLPAPAQPPVINGPLNPSTGLPTMGSQQQ
jgi:hypothetical protein